MTSVSSEPITGTLRVEDARLHYEVRGSGPLVALVGAPMDAAAFGPLAELLAGTRTVLTTDPRGIGRSPLDDPEQDSTPLLRAGDLAALIEHLDAGPAAVFGSSGGACTVLALAESRPGLVRTVIAHEPPLDALLDDREQLHEATDEMIETYLGGDVIGAWRRFMATAGIMMPDEVLQQMFGGERDPRQVADERRWFAHELRGTVRWRPGLDALRQVRDRIVVGVGKDSAGQLCDRSSQVLAKELGLATTTFPGGHTGFADDPAGFAERFRTVLGAA